MSTISKAGGDTETRDELDVFVFLLQVSALLRQAADRCN